MIDAAIEWANAAGPPNWVFVVALLTAPFKWSRYVVRIAENAYERRYGGDDAPDSEDEGADK